MTEMPQLIVGLQVKTLSFIYKFCVKFEFKIIEIYV